MGWRVEFEAFTELLEQVAHDYPAGPILITENGAAFRDEVAEDGQVHDSSRVDYLRRLIAAIHDAISPSVDVKGFTYWSLMDNVEWAFGYGSRFGLVRVDYDTQTRRLKDSAHAYGEIIRANGLPPSPHAAWETGGHSPWSARVRSRRSNPPAGVGGSLWTTVNGGVWPPAWHHPEAA